MIEIEDLTFRYREADAPAIEGVTGTYRDAC